VGPDLSTIGVKYGRDELVRSILSPSAAIGFSYRSLVLALADGRVVTGLLVDETPNRLVVKTAEGQRITLDPRSVADRRTSDVSLMPEGLAGSMTTPELVDLLAYLASLNKPVSIVGQYHAAGPLYEPNGTPVVDPASKLDLRAPLGDGRGQQLSWRRVTANAEGQADFTPLLAGDAKHVAYVTIPVVSPTRQEAMLKVESSADITAWLNGKPVALSAQGEAKDEPLGAVVDLPQGPNRLLLRLAPGARAKPPFAIVTTFVSDQPVAFDAGDAGVPSRAEPR
jgi:putative heme-binding domain-containing protein